MTPAGKSYSASFSSCSSDSAWVFQRLAEIQGAKAQSGGSAAFPKRPIYSLMTSSGEPVNRITSASSGSVTLISPSPKEKLVVSQLSTYSPKPVSVQKKGAAQ